jgi:DNA-binding NtrC family response regulator
MNHNLKKILVIDDDVGVRTTLCENLRDSGFYVTEASNGLDGLVMINRHGSPDVIITDIIMPGMGGLEAIQEIRRLSPRSKVIAISGGGRTESEDFLETALREGAVATFPKPFDMDKLEATIMKLFASNDLKT